MNANTADPVLKPKYVVLPATEADLPTLVDIQFKTFAWFMPEVLAAGPDTPENQAAVLAKHLDFLKKEPCTRVVKVEVEHDHGDGTKAEADADAADTQNSNGNRKQARRIVGFCIFVLPNVHASTAEERIPLSVRPKPTPLQAPWIADPVRRAKVEIHLNAAYPAVQSVVAGRSCAVVRYMSVLPEYQRQGIGHLVMDWGCKVFDEAGVDACLLAAPGAERLYGHFGFREGATMEFVDTSGAEPPAESIPCTVMWRKAGTTYGL